MEPEITVDISLDELDDLYTWIVTDGLRRVINEKWEMKNPSLSVT